MGVLDDAIREHLDLKRRRGGDPVEIERAEQEALGPVRRGPEDIEQPQDAPPTNGDEYAGYETEPEWDDHHAEQDEYAAPPTAEHAEQVRPPQPFDHGDTLEPAEESDHGEALDQAGPPFDQAEAGEQSGTFDHGQETAEYDIEGHLKDDKGDKDEDVLEETPEFLQDTPEHDRLWFEQRPPRDFDFEG